MLMKSVSFILLLLSLASFPLSAHQGATGVVKERMMLMKSMGKQLKRLKRTLSINSSKNLDASRKSIAHMRQQSQVMLQLFPPGSRQHPSEALPEIWSNWSEFEQLNLDMDQQLVKLEQMLTSANAKDLAAQLSKVNQLCSSCHDKFRLEQ